MLYNFFIPRHELITKNDWTAVFDERLRGPLVHARESGERNLFGLTYEFNLLHVGTTRARTLLAVFDESQTMRIQALGPSVSNAVSSSDLEAFRVQWQTDAPSAAAYRRLGERLIERDSPQALRFFQLAATRYRDENELRSAAECFERGRQYVEAASCAAATGDTPEELRLRARHSEGVQAFEEAAKLQERRGQFLAAQGDRESAAQAYSETARLYQLGDLPTRQAQAILSKAEVLPTSHPSARAASFEDAAVVFCGSHQTSECVEARRRAIEEAERAGLSGSSTIGVMPAIAWRGVQYLHIATHRAESKLWVEAATDARTASGLLRTASEQASYAPSQKALTSEQSDMAAAQAIDYLLNAREFSKARQVRRALQADTSPSAPIEQRVIWWSEWLRRYAVEFAWDDFADSAVEIGAMLSNRKEYSRALQLLGEAAKTTKIAKARNPTMKVLTELVRDADRADNRQAYGRALIERGGEAEEQRLHQEAFDDFRSAARVLVPIGDLEVARGALERALACGQELLQPPALGMFCVRDVAIALFARSGLARDAFHWTERAATLFARTGLTAPNLLSEVLERERATVEGLKAERAADVDRSREIDRRLADPLKSLAWHEVCLALTYQELSKSDPRGDQLTKASHTLDSALDRLREAVAMEDAAVIQERVRGWHR